MPLFYYECENCKNIWEELISSSDKEIVCKKCNNNKVHRIFGKTNKIKNWKSSTPLDDDSSSSSKKVLMRIPEYKDRNTGKKLGMGSPEVKIV